MREHPRAVTATDSTRTGEDELSTRRTDWLSWIGGALVPFSAAALMVLPVFLTESTVVHWIGLVAGVLLALAGWRIVHAVRPATGRKAYLAGLAVGGVVLLFLWITLASFSAPAPA
jgi:4-hydroxybenzoate polyprenyltransferase